MKQPKQGSENDEQLSSVDLGGDFNADGEWEWHNTVASLLPEDPLLSALPSEPSSSIEAFPELQGYDWDYLATCLQKELRPVADFATTNQVLETLSPAKVGLPPIPSECHLPSGTDQSRPTSFGAQSQFRLCANPVVERAILAPSTRSNQREIQPRTTGGAISQSVSIYPSCLSNRSQIQPRTQEDLSRYHGPPRLGDMSRFKMTITAEAAPDYMSNNQDRRSGINGHRFGDDSLFGFGPALTRLSPTSGEYREELALSPIRPPKRRREGEISPTPSIQILLRPDNRQRSESADKQGTRNGLSRTPEAQEVPVKRERIISSGGRVTTTNPKTKGLNSRSANIERFKPFEHYKALEVPPQSWGVDSADQFKYNQWGELDRAAYSTQEILDFIYRNPANQIQTNNRDSKTHAPRQSTFTLWIQTVPADSNRRYPTPDSDKCRLQSCPAPNRTIAKGFHRIALDEHSTTTGLSRDPFHVAAYLHLYCVEKLLDFPRLCADLCVQADARCFAAEKNRMSIVRDYEECRGFVEAYVRSAKAKAMAMVLPSVSREMWRFEGTLECALTGMQLELQPEGRARARLLLGMRNHIGLHRNDLEVFLRGEEEKRRNRKRKVGSGDGLGGEVSGKRGRR